MDFSISRYRPKWFKNLPINVFNFITVYRHLNFLPKMPGF